MGFDNDRIVELLQLDPEIMALGLSRNADGSVQVADLGAIWASGNVIEGRTYEPFGPGRSLARRPFHDHISFQEAMNSAVNDLLNPEDRQIGDLS